MMQQFYSQVLSKRSENVHKKLSPSVRSSFIHYCLKLEITHKFINRRVDKWPVSCSYIKCSSAVKWNDLMIAVILCWVREARSQKYCIAPFIWTSVTGKTILCRQKSNQWPKGRWVLLWRDPIFEVIEMAFVLYAFIRPDWEYT